MRDKAIAAVVERQPLTLNDLSILHEYDPQRYPHLLESVAQGQLGQFDILFAFPQTPLVLEQASQSDVFKQSFFADYQSHHSQVESDSDLPFRGGWFVYFAYEYAQVVEPSLQAHASELPMAWIQHCSAAVLIDHRNQQVCFVGADAAQVAQMQADYQACITKGKGQTPVLTALWQEEAPQDYINAVERIKEYILAGDVFQVNVSRLWQTTTQATPLQVYRQLRENNPAPFACLLNFEADHQAWSIISSSPERLVRYQDGWVETRPIAGTRKRSDAPEKDLALIEELISHPKERAEHIMLIDLERNDLGRICQPGTVEVNELMVVETYRHVHHIVSNVRGHLREGMNPLDVVEAVFPGGTITGCPKVRCMEIIHELESGAREAYTGSAGYINYDGTLDLNILIRSFLQQGDQLRFRAGAGIVADSIAEKELEETRHKAKGLLRALEGR